MAANLTPQYHEAEQRYKAATAPAERLEALEEMLREIPKHKSSEKMQAELKRKGGGAQHDPFHIPPSGAGQIVLIGPPNAGKSSIVGALTNAPVKIADFPFSTPLPLPGMIAFEDVRMQIVDTPPVTAEHVPTGFPGLWRSTDVLLVVVDLSADSLLEDAEACFEHLRERRIELHDPRSTSEEEMGKGGAGFQPAGAGGKPAPPAHLTATSVGALAPGAMQCKTGLLLATKRDLPGTSDNLALLRELLGDRVSIEPISVHDPVDAARLPALFFSLLGVIRVYAKPPGKKAEQGEPFVLPAGATVLDMARKVHRGLAEHIKSARLWGSAAFPGQNVQLDHVLHDKDTVELHA
jgi:ribosome-interacting GTPase 1